MSVFHLTYINSSWCITYLLLATWDVHAIFFFSHRHMTDLSSDLWYGSVWQGLLHSGYSCLGLPFCQTPFYERAISLNRIVTSCDFMPLNISHVRCEPQIHINVSYCQGWSSDHCSTNLMRWYSTKIGLVVERLFGVDGADQNLDAPAIFCLARLLRK